MQKITIKLEPLTAEAFKPYGDVIEVDENNTHFPINLGSVERFHDLASVETGQEGRALISIATCNILASLPHRITLFERHPLGSQCFMPLDHSPIVVAVTERGEYPEASKIRAFISNGYQGINYHTGVWHMPIIFLQKNQRMLIVDRGGEGNNCDEWPFPDEEIIISEETS